MTFICYIISLFNSFLQFIFYIILLTAIHQKIGCIESDVSNLGSSS